jgi:uncharacterized protein
MKINISNIADGDQSFDFIERGKEFDLDYLDPESEIKIHIDLFRSNNQLDLNITLNGFLNLECDRCIERYEMLFEKKFHLIYKIDFTGDLIDSDDDVLKFISPKTRIIDLRNDIRDYILLSIPMRRVPEEKDDVCLYCNRDVSEVLEIKRQETINPVWEKLLKIKQSR